MQGGKRGRLNAIFEYIIAGLIMLIMVSAVHTNISNMINDKLILIEQEEYSTAESILDMILLSPGIPTNWGNSTEPPVLFGLASEKATEVYNLDANKVIRLDENSSLYIYPGELRSLLGLNSECNFIIRLNPILTIDIESLGYGDYEVTVKDSKGFPAPNVNVTGYYVHKSLIPHSEQIIDNAITEVDGKCTLSFDQRTDYVLVVCASLLEVKTMKIESLGYDFRVEGDRVIRGEVPLVNSITYTTGSFYGLVTQRAERYVMIDGFTYLFEFEIWR
jgi:hypothetical protein